MTTKNTNTNNTILTNNTTYTIALPTLGFANHKYARLAVFFNGELVSVTIAEDDRYFGQAGKTFQLWGEAAMITAEGDGMSHVPSLTQAAELLIECEFGCFRLRKANDADSHRYGINSYGSLFLEECEIDDIGDGDWQVALPYPEKQFHYDTGMLAAMKTSITQNDSMTDEVNGVYHEIAKRLPKMFTTIVARNEDSDSPNAVTANIYFADSREVAAAIDPRGERAEAEYVFESRSRWSDERTLTERLRADGVRSFATLNQFLTFARGTVGDRFATQSELLALLEDRASGFDVARDYIAERLIFVADLTADEIDAAGLNDATLEVLQQDALTFSDEDYQSERQIAAENRFWIRVQFLSGRTAEQIEAVVAKMGSTEAIDYGYAIATSPDDLNVTVGPDGWRAVTKNYDGAPDAVGIDAINGWGMSPGEAVQAFREQAEELAPVVDPNAIGSLRDRIEKLKVVGADLSAMLDETCPCCVSLVDLNTTSNETVVVDTDPTAADDGSDIVEGVWVWVSQYETYATVIRRDGDSVLIETHQQTPQEFWLYLVDVELAANQPEPGDPINPADPPVQRVRFADDRTFVKTDRAVPTENFMTTVETLAKDFNRVIEVVEVK